MTTDEPPIMPTAKEVGDRVTPPRVVTIAYWLWLVGGAIGLAGGIAAIQIKETLVSHLVDTQRLAVEEASAVVQGQTIFIVSGSAVFLLLYWLLAYQARNGVRKARTLLAVVGVLGGLFQFIFAIRVFGSLAAMLAVIAILLLFLPRASRFYDAHGR